MAQIRNTILAALRFYHNHQQGEPSKRTDEIHDLATNNEADISLDQDAIEELIKTIETKKPHILLD